MRRPLATITAALALVALPAATAYADPTDPAPGWSSMSTDGTIRAAVGGDGGAHVAADESFDQPATLFWLGPDGQRRSATETDYHGPHLATGVGDSAVVVADRGTKVVAQRHSERGWSGEHVVADGLNGVRRLALDTNLYGDPVVTWADNDGQFHAATGGGGWSVTTPPVVNTDPAGVHRFRVSKPVINDAGKSSLVWFQPAAKGGGQLMRSILESGGRRWSTARPIATLASDPAHLALTTDTWGRETVAAGSLVWRQVHPNAGFRFQFQATGATSVDLAASGPRTRVAWMTRSGHTFSVKTRLIVDAELRPTRTVWTKSMSKKWRAGCFAKAGTLVAVAPQGRSYLAWAVDSPYGLAGCPEFGGGVVARVAAVNGADREVGAHNVSYLRGHLSSLSVTGRGPVALTYVSDYNDNGWGTTARSVFLSR
ncbi:hypothetical protein [Nocardioides speluncae]|uniref:hypothetical protein n=1 Tax=Nocardioides speluncae TaxID=2670337 RepID=UPI000D69C96D|nr:hypothetical protein [Nocardioides speluncae]